MSVSQIAKTFVTTAVFVAWAMGSADLLWAHEAAQATALPAVVGDAGARSLQSPADDAEPEWTCPMHPEVHQHEPGRCPQCKMKLIQVSDQVD